MVANKKFNRANFHWIVFVFLPQKVEKKSSEYLRVIICKITMHEGGKSYL